MTDPLVSVLIPAFNQAAYVDAAIASAVEQDYEPLEVIVVDDGSIDGTKEIIKRWAERYPQRVVAIVDEPHVGITRNCNRGIRRARGKYYALHAGDDLMLPGKIRKQVQWLEADASRVMCGHDVDNFDSESGRTLWRTSETLGLCRGRGAERLVRRFALLPGSSLMVRADAVPSFGYDERVEVVSDIKFQIDILAGGGGYGYVDGVLARYRVHPDSTRVRSMTDAELHHQWMQGILITLAIVESDYPSLAAAAGTARAVHLFSEGRWQQQRGNDAAARAYFRHAMRLAPLRCGPKALVAAASTYAPADLMRRVEALLRRRRPES